MGVLKKVVVENFRGFGEKREFDFEGKPLILLNAPNGKGKTSLLDAIEWCLTGDIRRLHETYNKRNSTTEEQKRAINNNAILKNKEYLNERVRVEVEIAFDEKDYSIIRTQEEDTLKNRGDLCMLKHTYENREELENPEEFLSQFVDYKNFYKYHICDMQKTYNFLCTGRREMMEEFSEFTADYSEAQNIIKNLELYCDDIKKKTKYLNNQKIEESEITNLEEKRREYEQSAQIIPYKKIKLYPLENTEINTMEKEELNRQLKDLICCGYNRILELLKRKVKNNKLESIKTRLDDLKDELSSHEKDIRKAIELGINNRSVCEKAEQELSELNDIRLSENNLEAFSQKIIGFKNECFTEDYWEKNKKQLNDKKQQLANLDTDINMLTKGNKVIDILTTIVAGKDSLILYRDKLRQEKSVEPIVCPICGSEQFGYLDNDEITEEAKKYQAEHKQLIENKKQERLTVEKEKEDMLTEVLSRAKKALNEEIKRMEEYVNELRTLSESAKVYFSNLEKLQNIDGNRYTQERMLSIQEVEKEIEEKNRVLLSKEELTVIEEELQRVFDIINEVYDENQAIDMLIRSVELKIQEGPKEIQYEEQLLRDKIISIRTYINNLEFQELNKNINNMKKKNGEITTKIEALNKLSSKANNYKKQVNTKLEAIRKKEYAQVGPYLYKIFRKLSRDVSISDFELSSRIGSKNLALTNKEGQSILNILSDGQLSVFMLSYFLGNAMRLKNKNQFRIYFIDDITSCMDDINMLAFLDFMKYQLSNTKGAFQQIFFATCDSRIQNLLCWKMDGCGIPYKKIGIEDFECQIYTN